MFNFIIIGSTSTERKCADRQTDTHDLSYCLSLVYAHECCGQLTSLWLSGRMLVLIAERVLVQAGRLDVTALDIEGNLVMDRLEDVGERSASIVWLDLYTRLFKTIVGVLTSYHMQYT